MFPAWLHLLAIAALLLGGGCFLVLLVAVIRQPQPMGVMNVVWPVAGLFGTVVAVWGYRRYGTSAMSMGGGHGHGPGGEQGGHDHKGDVHEGQPFAAAVGKGALHCGSGCMIGDVAAEWLAFLFPAIAAWCGYGWLFGEKMFAVWVLDFVFAFALGIVFQYFAIAPMRHLSVGQGLLAALQADALSLISWQLGMYGCMAFVQFYLFGTLLGQRAAVDTPEFWFAMQLAMVAGFVTAFPVNWWLLRAGIKERM